MKERLLKLDLVGKIIAINVAVFVLVNALLIFGLFESIDSWHSSPFSITTTSDLGRLIYIPWTSVTHMFVHFGIRHIFWNMIILYLGGRLFLDYFNKRKLVSIYFLGGFAGFISLIIIGLASARLAGDIPTYGASAAVMCILVSACAYAPDRNIRLLLIGDVKLWVIGLIVVILDFVQLRDGSNYGGHIAHLGGALFGFLFAYYYKQGKDLSLWFERLIDRITNIFKGGGTKMKIVKKPTRKKQKEKVYKTDEQYSLEKKIKQKKLDDILDKISHSGYDSLTSEERDFLFKQSED